MNLPEIRRDIETLHPSSVTATLFAAISADIAERLGIADAPLEQYLNGGLSPYLTDEIRLYAARLTEDGLLFLLNSILWWATEGEFGPLFGLVDHCFPLDAKCGEYSELYRICKEEGVSIIVHDIARNLFHELGARQYRGQELEKKITECIEVVVAARDIIRCESLLR